MKEMNMNPVGKFDRRSFFKISSVSILGVALFTGNITANQTTQEEARETVVDFSGPVNYGKCVPIVCKTKTVEVFFVKVSLHRDEIRAKIYYRFTDNRSDGDVLFKFSFLDNSGKSIDSRIRSEARIRDIPQIGYGEFKTEKDKPNREGCVNYKFDTSRINEIAKFRVEVQN